MRCFGRFGCFVVVLLIACAAWFTRDHWLYIVSGSRTVTTAAAPEKTWQPLDSAAGERGKRAVDDLSNPKGPVFTNLTAAEVGSYVVQAVGKSFPSAADSVEAAVIGDLLYVRAIVPTKDIAGS